MVQSNMDLSLTILAVAAFSFSGWMIFTGLNGLFPQISELSPIMKVVVGFAGIFTLVKLGIRRLQ